MSVKPIHIPFSDVDIEQILAIIRDKLERGYVSQGDYVEAFEAEFARYTQSTYAIAVNSGSAAIEIAVRMKEPSGGTVLLQANTNFATYSSIERAGARIRLVDINLQTLAPSLDDLRAAYDEHVIGVVIVHMGGIISPDIAAIKNWCDVHSIWLLEDCAHAHASRFNKRHAGRFGFAGAFSFFATKVITSGEGGMLITDDPQVAQEAQLHRNLGKEDIWHNQHIRMGTNARMSEFNAIIGYFQLKHLDEFVSIRRKIAEVYTRRLGDIALLSPILPDGPSSFYKYTVMLDASINRNRIKESMGNDDVYLAGEIYEIPLHQQPVLRERHLGESFPNSEAYCNQHVCLPIHPGIDVDQANFVIDRLLHHVCSQASRRTR